MKYWAKQAVPDDLPLYVLKDLSIRVQQNLKKKDPPYVLPILRCNQIALETELFAASYKGVTDLVTNGCGPASISGYAPVCAAGF